MDIPDDLDFTTPLTLADFPCEGIEWDNLGGRATMAGDAAHAMTMFVSSLFFFFPLFSPSFFSLLFLSFFVPFLLLFSQLVILDPVD